MPDNKTKEEAKSPPGAEKTPDGGKPPEKKPDNNVLDMSSHKPVADWAKVNGLSNPDHKGLLKFKGWTGAERITRSDFDKAHTEFQSRKKVSNLPDGMKLIEEWAKSDKIKLHILIGIRSMRKWGIGQPITFEQWQKAKKDFFNLPIGGAK